MKKSPRKHLTRRLAASYLVVSVLGFMAFFVLIAQNQMGIISQNVRYESDHFAEVLVNDLKLAKVDDVAGLKHFLQGRLERGVLLDSQGQPLFSLGEFEVEPKRLREEARKAVLGSQMLGEDFVSSLSLVQSEIHYAVPIALSGGEGVTLHFPLQLNQIENQFKQLGILALLAFALSVMFQALLAFVVHRLLVKPILQISNSALQAAMGDFRPVQYDDRSDEIGILQSSYNHMVDIISKTFRTLNEQRAQLELGVESAKQAASTDPLTGAANRRAMEEKLPGLLADCYKTGRPVSLLMMDIDHFKKVNDTWGHQVGDEVLKNFAHSVQLNIHKADFLARYGGEEFVLTLPDLDHQTAFGVAERIRKGIAESNINPKAGVGATTVSLGLTCLYPSNAPLDQNVAESLIGLADSALYRAKTSGRNRCLVQLDDK